MSPLDPQNPTPPDGKQPDQQEVVKFAKEKPVDTSVMPTMLGAGYGTYQVRPENFVLSFVTHGGAILLMLWLLHIAVPAKIIPPTTANSVDLAPYVPICTARKFRALICDAWWSDTADAVAASHCGACQNHSSDHGELSRSGPLRSFKSWQRWPQRRWRR